MSNPTVMQQAYQKMEDASQERVFHPGGLVVTVDKRLGTVGGWVEVLPSLYGTFVMSYEHGCQVWLRSVDVQAWAAHHGG